MWMIQFLRTEIVHNISQNLHKKIENTLDKAL